MSEKLARSKFSLTMIVKVAGNSDGSWTWLRYEWQSSGRSVFLNLIKNWEVKVAKRIKRVANVLRKSAGNSRSSAKVVQFKDSAYYLRYNLDGHSKLQHNLEKKNKNCTFTERPSPRYLREIAKSELQTPIPVKKCLPEGSIGEQAILYGTRKIKCKRIRENSVLASQVNILPHKL